jgi:ADP-ribose diphosphatase
MEIRMCDKPKILQRQNIARSRLFTIESVALQFSNGNTRHYERLSGLGSGAVLVVPILAKQSILLVKEYAVGIEDYALSFPKGLIDNGESSFEAANRELKEEIGYGAHQLTQLTHLTLAPGYVSGQISVILAEDLYQEKLIGDEPEEMEVIQWPLSDIPQLLARTDFHEARSLAALFIALQHIQNRS